MEIREALGQLDPFNDDHWTNDGAPKIDIVKGLTEGPVTRQDIIDTAPDFSKDNMVLPTIDDGSKDEDISEEDDVPTESYIEMLEQFIEAEPMEPTEFAQFLNQFPKEGLVDLQSVMVTQREHAEEAIRLATDLQRRVKIGLNWVNSRIKVEIPDMSTQQAIQHYIKTQQETRLAKHTATTEILKGIKLSDLDPRAAIDKAMARKTGRGMGRPGNAMK